MVYREVLHRNGAKQSIAPQSTTGAVNGSSVDLLGFGAALALFLIGAVADGAVGTLGIDESNDGSTWTDADAAGHVVWGSEAGAATAPTTTNAGAGVAVRAAYVGSMRYIRLTFKSVSGGAILIGGVVDQALPDQIPIN